MPQNELDSIHEEEDAELSWVTHWSDLEARWGAAEEFAVRMDGVSVPGFPAAYSPSEFAKRPAPPWLIPTLIPSGLTALFGPTNSGKTFIALDAALSICTANQWAGQELLPVNVMYFLAEGQGEASKRVEAWCQMRGVDLDDLTGKFWIVPQRLPLLGVEPDGVNMAVIARRLGIGLVVLDTWARTLEGDENSNTDVSATVNLLTDIRANSDISVWIVHHTGIADGGRMRGASALAAALDCEIRVEGHLQDPVAPRVELHCTKQRDAIYFESFALEVVPTADSIAFDPIPRELTAVEAMPVRSPEDAVMADLVQVLQLGPRAKKELANALGMGEGGIRRMLQALEESGKVERLGSGPTLRYRLVRSE